MTDWKDGDMLDTLAAAHAETGDFESAIKHEKKAIELDPNSPKLLGHLTLFRDGKPVRD